MSSSPRIPLFTRTHIAPCGINCGTCIAYLREKNRCAGCNSVSGSKAHHCEECSIKNCKELSDSGGKYCFSCGKFPCQRVRQLDKRYRTVYGISLIDNLRAIKEHGIREFVRNEHERWKCPACGSTLSVHRKECPECRQPKQI
jgi:hypothetical protein